MCEYEFGRVEVVAYLKDVSKLSPGENEENNENNSHIIRCWLKKGTSGGLL
jgi:hypothetical protein